MRNRRWKVDLTTAQQQRATYSSLKLFQASVSTSLRITLLANEDVDQSHIVYKK
jgi:hypothetical protein